MKCKFCETEFDDSFNYCPNCGKKAPQEEKLVLRNTDWLRFATMKELEAFLPELKAMDAEELSKWCCGMHENIRVYQIRVFYFWTYKGETKIHRASFYGLTVQETVDEINRMCGIGCVQRIGSIEAKESNLSKTFKEEDEGTNWFRTKEECEVAISKIKIRKELLNG